MNDYIDLGFKILVYEVDHEKSVQLQVQFRREKKGHKSFKPYAAPLLLEIDESETWGQCTDKITLAIEGKYTDADENSKLANSRASSRKSFKEGDKKSQKERRTLRPRRKSIMAGRIALLDENVGDPGMRPHSEME